MLYQLSYIGLNRPSAISRQPSAKTSARRRLPNYCSVSLSPSGCITSLRRSQVFSANIARTASVAKRIRGSLNVVHDSTPRTTNAASANVETIHSSLWCTGKDSNLRTSEEGQIYSLLALTTHPPVQNCRTVRPYLPYPAFLADIHATEDRSDGFSAKLRMTIEKVKNRKAREYTLARKHHTWKIPYGVPLENSVKPPPRRISCLPEPMLELAKGFEPLTL